MNRVVRVASDDVDNPFRIDLVVDEYGTVNCKIPVHGSWGPLGAADTWAFLCRWGKPEEPFNGLMNFGEEVDDHGNTVENNVKDFGLTNIGSKIIRRGEQFTVRYDGDEHLMTIKAVVDLATLEPYRAIL